ncbi:MAG: hypothetical protein OCD02_04395 [Spirochaetaceae bacterium]
MKNKAGFAIVLLFIMSSINIVGLLITIIISYLEILPAPNYFESLPLFFKVRSISLVILLPISAIAVSKKKLFSILAIIVYLLLALIPRLIIQFKMQELGLVHIFNYIQYLIVFIILLFLNSLRRKKYFI